MEKVRVSRYSDRNRDRDDYSSDEGRSTYSRSRHGGDSYRTVQRYRVTPSRVEEVEDDRRSSHLDISGPRGSHIEVDRHSERFVEPDRPRSAVELRARSEFHGYEREPLREERPERTRTIVYERERDRPREPDFNRPWERAPARPWETEQVRETDVRIERRREDGYDREIYQKETEYYDRPEPPPQPIVIRQRAPEPQQIIVQEAPQPPPIVLPAPEQQGFEVIRRTEVQQEVARPEPRPEPRREDEEYYYRRDVREVGPRRDEEVAVARYDRRDARDYERDYSDNEEYTRRRVVRRERSRSGSPHHKRHLAEGALAGAGAAALLASHREKQGSAPEHRGRNVVGGAALGAIGAEVLTRARSRYRDSRGDSRSRSRSSGRSHSKVRTALGLAAAGIAAAAAVKYAKDRRANREEYGRGRSRTRSRSRRRRRASTGDYYSDEEIVTRSRSRHADPKHRASTIAKAGAATAAVAGVVQHFRSKSRSRSKSRIRAGAEIAASGLAGAAVAGLYENRKAKEDQVEDEAEIRRERRRSRSRGSRSRGSRSRARSLGTYSDPGVDPELGLVQYGTDPVYTHTQTTTQYYDDPALVNAGTGAAYGATRSRRSRTHRRHSSSSDDRRRSRSRSRSKVRDIAGAAAGTAAAAIGINQYKKRKEKKEMARERERRRYEEESPPENYYARGYHDDGYSPSPPHASGGSYYPDNTAYPSPPTAAGVGGQPVYNSSFTNHPTTSSTNVGGPPIPTYNPQDYAPPQQTANPYTPPAQGPGPMPSMPVPRSGNNVSANNIPRNYSPPVGVNTFSPTPPPNSNSNISPISKHSAAASGAPYFPPPPTAPFEEQEPLQRSQSDTMERVEEARRLNTPPTTPPLSPLSSPSPSTDRPHNKSVMFAPLSPTSSRRLAKIHQDAVSSSANIETAAPSSSSKQQQSSYQTPVLTPDEDTDPYSDFRHHRSSGKRRRRRRRNSDPSSDRPNQPSKHRRRQRNASRSPSPSRSDDEVEILPDRFDEDGRPLDRHGNSYRSRGGGAGGGDSAGQEMVEKLVHDIGDVVDGRKSWKDMLRGLVVDSPASSSAGGSHPGRERRRR